MPPLLDHDLPQRHSYDGSDQPAHVVEQHPRLLTTAEAAVLLRVSTKTIARLVAAGRLPSFRIAGHGPRRFRHIDVDHLLERESPTVGDSRLEDFINTKLGG